MDEREITTSVSFGLSKLSPLQASAQVEFRRRWNRRSEALLETVAEASRLSADEIHEMVLADEVLGDLLQRALERGRVVASADYRADLGRLVSAAFRDQALVEPVGYVGSVVLQLEPADLRVLRAAAGTSGSQEMDGLAPHTFPTGVQVLAGEVAALVALEPSLIAASLDRMSSFGLVFTPPAKDKRFAQGRAQNDNRLWSVTPFALRVLGFCDGLLITSTVDE